MNMKVLSCVCVMLHYALGGLDAMLRVKVEAYN